MLSPRAARRGTISEKPNKGEKKAAPTAETEEKKLTKEEPSEVQGASEPEEEVPAHHDGHEEVCHTLKQATVFVEVVDDDEADDDEGNQSAKETTEDTKVDATEDGAGEHAENDTQQTETEKETEQGENE